MSSHPEFDAIIVGSGFGGCYLLHKLREAGFKCLVIDEAADLGGVWFWNCYRGARADTPVPLYEFSNEKIWKDWTWSERYPGRDEIRRYFDHVESKLDLKKDILFSTRVTAAEFDQVDNYWNVVDNAGVTRTARYFLLCTGFASKPHHPAFDGAETFAGVSCHTSKWPQNGIDFKDKRVGIIGTGPSGIQIIQDVAGEVAHMTVFQRSPTYAIPMRQAAMGSEIQDKSEHSKMFELRKKTFFGFGFEPSPKSAIAVSDEEREAHFEHIWSKGGNSICLENFHDVISDARASEYAYKFWRQKTLPRLKKPGIAELLAPETSPYHFGTKRLALEQRYYEVYNQDNVDLVDIKTSPLEKVVPNGIVTRDGKLRELDVLIFATGFDAVTGGILSIDIKGVGGISLTEKWKDGTYTQMGLMTAGFPNMIFLYGPQSPVEFCNGPTCAEVQGDWIAKTLIHLRDLNRHYISATVNAEQDWRKLVAQIGNTTLFSQTKSEFMGSNIPGKPEEMLNFLGGLPEYRKHLNHAHEVGLEVFTTF